MDKLRAMTLFVRLAETGSFTAVAEELGQSKSMVSKEISRLEADVGARLLQRSTRNLQLTSVGEGYLQRCREILKQIDDADAYVRDVQGGVKGKLRINAPMALGITDLDRMFSAFMQAYPYIELDIHLGDEEVDLVKEGFDLGFRVTSRLADSSYVGKALTQFRYRVCASPDYLQQHPLIREPEDLLQHNCFVYRYFVGKNVWPLGEGVAVSGNLTVNSTPFMKRLVMDGLGIAFMPEFICRDELADGRMQEVLVDVPRPQSTLYAMYPSRRYLQPKLLRCVEFLQDWFQP